MGENLFFPTFVFFVNFECMEPIELNVLGCGSALPTSMHLPSCQVLSAGNKLYMIDCGEGAQLQYRKCGLSFSKLRAIFITHIHGDHCFGLPGLLSTFALLGRKSALEIHAPTDVTEAMQAIVKMLCGELPFPLYFCPFDASAVSVIYEDRTLTVSTLPLRHRVRCAGFLFKEKQGLRHLDKASCDFYGVPVSSYGLLKNGNDYVTPSGELIPNDRLTRPADPVRSFAYCSDTAYQPRLTELVAGVDLLYHEATFAESEASRAKETFHSTAIQAAQIAKSAEVKRLLIGHYSARYLDQQILLDEAKSVFPETYLSYEGLKLVL